MNGGRRHKSVAPTNGWAARILDVGGKYDDSCEGILAAVERGFDMPLSVMKTSSKTRPFVAARGALMYLLRKHTNLSLEEIGRVVGRDHSTVIFALKKVVNNLEHSDKWKEIIDQFEKEIAGPPIEKTDP